VRTGSPPADWFPRRGDVYWVQMDKKRPALVISSNLINRYALDVCVVPITSVEHAKFSFRVVLSPPQGGVDRESCAKCDQVTTFEKARFIYPPLGRTSHTILQEIERAIKLALQLP
jgi:mRNA-degrading endonuclease toxin of MazEF toxin-antitoxin module